MALRKNLKHQTKTITLDVPADSDLPSRLKKISKQTGLSPFNLIQKWVLQEESLAGLIRQTRIPTKAVTEMEKASSAKGRKKNAATEPKKSPKASKTPKNADYRNMLAKRVKKLKKEGMTLEKIAATFNDEKVATVSGTGKWYTSSISWLIKPNKAG